MLTIAAACISAALATPPATTDTTFTITHTPPPGHAVFVVGDRPELGGNDPRRAVKLVNTAGNQHTITVALPTAADYTYRFITRNDAAGQWGNAANTNTISQTFADTAPGDTPPQAAVLFSTDFAEPVLYHGAQFQPLTATPMTDIGEGRNPGERLFLAENLGDPTILQQFYIDDASGFGRSPSSGVLALNAPLLFVQDNSAFAYLPNNTTITPARKDYNPASPPTLFSTTLSEQRTYRVFLPRGYDQHTEKHYPVLYMNDGQNIFDFGAFGTWNADEAAERAQRLGLARETIIVAVDHGPDRTGDYLTPFDGFNADDYAAFLINELKPLIDATYRTLTDANNTAIAGSSFGGVVSMYLAYEFPQTFARAAVFSPSVWAMPTFLAHIAATPNPDLRLYLDSGDAGTSNDGFDGAVQLRDTLAANTINPYTIESQLRHTVGFGQAHNESAWATRFPNAYAWLFQTAEEPDRGLADLLPPTSCTPADIAAPFGTLDLSDVDAFVLAFLASEPLADFAPPQGIIDLDDVDAFITAFFVICP